MSKKTMIIISVLLVIILIAAFGIRYFIGRPFYEPGKLARGENLRAPLTPPKQPADSSFWTVEADIQLHHFAIGQGRPVLVIHGGPGHPFAAPLPGLDSLTGNYRFEYYDQRGCGKSTRPFDRFTSQNYYENMVTLEKTLGISAQLADVERIRQILGEEKLIIIGHSFGAFLATMYAAEFPNRVAALILVCPATVLEFPNEENDLFKKVAALLPEEDKAAYAAFQEEYFDFGNIFKKSESDLIALHHQFADYYLKAVRPALTTPFESSGTGGWMVYAMYFSLGKQHDYRDALQKITAPALVLHGGKDAQSEAASQIYDDLIPNSEFHVLTNSSHFPFYEQPDEFALLVGQFLTRVE